MGEGSWIVWPGTGNIGWGTITLPSFGQKGAAVLPLDRALVWCGQQCPQWDTVEGGGCRRKTLLTFRAHRRLYSTCCH